MNTLTDELRASRPTSDVWAYQVRNDRGVKWHDIQDGDLPIARLVIRTAENSTPSPGWWATIDTEELRTVLRHDDGQVRYFETAQQALDAVDIAWAARTGRHLAAGDIAADYEGRHWHVLSVDVERAQALVESVATKAVFTAPTSHLARVPGMRAR